MSEAGDGFNILDIHGEEVLTGLEQLADRFGIQVLVTEDVEAIDTEVEPWLDNIIVDAQRCLLLPKSLSTNSKYIAWELEEDDTDG
tara:strand:- start:14 stop:271 length:258 start_codon:yes stop_codon:yes gene_type:complete